MDSSVASTSAPATTPSVTKEANKENEPSTSTHNPNSPSGSNEIELPNAIVTKIIRESLPQGVIVSKECRQAIAKAASIFVLYCTSSANNLVMENKRKTLRDIDILSALDEMDFSEFIPKLRESLEAYKTCTKNKKLAANERKKEKANSEKAAAAQAAGSVSESLTTGEGSINLNLSNNSGDNNDNSMSEGNSNLNVSQEEESVE